MIGLGAKYLTAAGFGRYRITAASLGSLDILGTWRWLNGVTQQAIMAAFGVDGTAVIAATNEYLNGIAASDKAKATALAALINEDPMMVCSLGLEVEGVTMPVRWLVGDGTAYIDLGFKGTTNDVAKLKFHNRSVTAQAWFGSRTSATSNAFGIGNDTNAISCDFGDYQVTRVQITPIPADTDFDIVISKNLRKVNSATSTAVYTGTVETPTNLYLFWGGPNYFTTNVSNGRFALCQVEGKAHMVPCIHNGANGMYDIERMRWFGNAASSGAFTISYTRNGQPWTPQTP